MSGLTVSLSRHRLIQILGIKCFASAERGTCYGSLFYKHLVPPGPRSTASEIDYSCAGILET